MEGKIDKGTDMIQPLIYLAGPIANATYVEAISWRQDFRIALSPEVLVLDPMRGKELLINTNGILGVDYATTPSPLITNNGILGRDMMDINRCDLMLVNLLDTKKASIGSCVEIGIALGANKPFILVIQKGNIHKHPFITTRAMYIIDNLLEAARLIKTTFGFISNPLAGEQED